MEPRQSLIEAAEGFEHAARAGRDLAAPRERLADAIRNAAFARLVTLANAALAEDLAQTMTTRVLDSFARGATEAARLPPYVDEAARNAFRDHRRRAATKRETPTSPADLPAVESDAPTPEETIATAQETHAVAARVRALVAQAPVAYREVLTRHYLDERPIQELVEDEVTARLIRDGHDALEPLERARLRPNARQTVDQRLCRARAWMQQRLTAREGGEP